MACEFEEVRLHYRSALLSKRNSIDDTLVHESSGKLEPSTPGAILLTKMASQLLIACVDVLQSRSWV